MKAALPYHTWTCFLQHISFKPWSWWKRPYDLTSLSPLVVHEVPSLGPQLIPQRLKHHLQSDCDVAKKMLFSTLNHDCQITSSYYCWRMREQVYSLVPLLGASIHLSPIIKLSRTKARHYTSSYSILNYRLLINYIILVGIQRRCKSMYASYSDTGCNHLLSKLTAGHHKEVFHQTLLTYIHHT